MAIDGGDRPSVLIADDDATTRASLATVVRNAGWQPMTVEDGPQALGALLAAGGPRVALVDWMMPGLSGIELCLQLRDQHAAPPPYVILITARNSHADVVAGLDSGADDYLVKPTPASELRARVRVALRAVDLRDRLAQRAKELETALAEVRQLRSLLPTCSYCRRIRDDANSWQSLEEYVSHHADVKFSHGFCPQCFDRYVQPQLDESVERHTGPR